MIYLIQYDIYKFTTISLKITEHFTKRDYKNGLYNQSLICYLFTAHLNLLGGRFVFGGDNEFFQQSWVYIEFESKTVFFWYYFFGFGILEWFLVISQTFSYITVCLLLYSLSIYIIYLKSYIKSIILSNTKWSFFVQISPRYSFYSVLLLISKLSWFYIYVRVPIIF